MATIATFAKNGLLDAMLRATASSAYTVGQILLANAAETVLIKYKTLGGSGAEFTAPANGATELVSPLSTSHSANDTIAKAGIRDTGGANDVVTPYTMSAGLAGGGVDIVVDDAVITAAEACNITDLVIALREFHSNGLVCMNTALRNRILAYFVRQNTAVFSGAGNITFYSGVPPATAEDTATGTPLCVFPTSTTTWAAASGGSSALSGASSVSAIASGTAGYARFVWSNGGQVYVIQGTAGGEFTAGAAFRLLDAEVVSGNLAWLDDATMTFD